jgi:hypothetical protein
MIDVLIRIEYPTANSQYPTHASLPLDPWILAVGCWMFGPHPNVTHPYIRSHQTRTLRPSLLRPTRIGADRNRTLAARRSAAKRDEAGSIVPNPGLRRSPILIALVPLADPREAKMDAPAQRHGIDYRSLFTCRASPLVRQAETGLIIGRCPRRNRCLCPLSLMVATGRARSPSAPFTVKRSR